MNELDFVRELRADTASPTREQLAAGRARLLAAMDGSRGEGQLLRRPPRARYLRRVLVAGVAGAVAALALEAHGSNTARVPVGTSKVKVRLAAQVLGAAATSVASQPRTRPAPYQWIYSSFIARTIGQATQRDEGWARFDGRQTAYLQGGQLIVHTSPVPPSGSSYPMGAYDALAKLPSSPKALLAAVGREVAENPASVAPPGSSPSDHRQTRQQLAFQFLAQLLWQAAQAAPARAEAAVFRALASIPGVSVERGIIDAAGRPAIGVSDTGDEQQLLLEARTYNVIGLRTISDGTWPVNVMAKGPGPTYPRGTVIESDAWVKVALVSRPGQR